MAPAPSHDGLPQRLAEDRFRRLYVEHGRAVHAYLLRRVGDSEDAADALHETFMVAWRRSSDRPEGEGERPWLYGVARRVLANQRRGARRRDRLHERLRDDLVASLPRVDGEVGGGELRQAMSRLEESDREILRLIAWEELTPTEAARALDISPVAARSRLFRARRHLRRELRRAGSALDLITPTPEEGR